MTSETPLLDNAVYGTETVRSLIEQYQQHLDVPDETAELAETLVAYRFTDDDTTPGRGYEPAVVGAIAVACDTHDIPRSLGDYTTASKHINYNEVPDFNPKTTGVDTSEIRHEKQQTMKASGNTVLPPDDTVYLERYLDELNITSDHMRDKVFDALDDVNAVKPNLSPPKKAAIAIEIAVRPDGYRKQNEIERVTHTTVVTLRTRRKEINEQLAET